MWANRWHDWYDEHGAELLELSGVEQPPPVGTQANQLYPELDLVLPGPNVNIGPVGANKFQCKYCGKGFARRQRLEACENEHRGERPYVCDASCGREDWYVVFSVVFAWLDRSSIAYFLIA
jgi:hypothetical protein